MLLAGHAQVHVRVDEGRQQVAPRALDDLGAVGRGHVPAGRELGDLAVAHDDVAGAVEAVARVEHVRAADEQRRRARRRRGRADHAGVRLTGSGWRSAVRAPARTS